MRYTALLSFDTEEFDVPREHGVDIPLRRSMEISRTGTANILDTLAEKGVKATFFCTSTFAENAPDIMRRIVDEGHEVAAHGCDHWRPQASDVFRSREILRELTGCEIEGYRQPRMFPVSDRDIARAGYLYNSSLNPAFIPGRYMHLNEPRTCFLGPDDVLQIPASVTPWIRFPMFWLACHHLPKALYRRLALRIMRHDGYFMTYFHPWEFYDTGAEPDLKLPYLITHNSGGEMVRRLGSLIDYLREKGATFSTFSPFAHAQIKKLKSAK